MISDQLVEVCSTDSPGITLRVCSREQGERWVPGGRDGTFYLNPVVSCRVCGEPAWANLRCTKHQDRNPCCVEGCKRSVAARGRELRDDQAVCGEHWRRYVPARSLLRRTYNRHWQLAKRFGWDDERVSRFERFWDAMVRRVRRHSTEGALDEREISAMFGWDEPG